MKAKKNNICGIIMAGGSGTRLSPVSYAANKHILPVYNKPMIYYPLSILLLNQIKNVLIITNKSDIPSFKKILGNGSRFGIKINYKSQTKPRGITDGLLISKDFIKKDDVFLILGDNIMFGSGMSEFFSHIWNSHYSTIYPYIVRDPERSGVVVFKNGKITKIIEKPKKFISEWIVTGLYFIKNGDLKLTKYIQPSKRNELEITDLLTLINKNKNLNYKKIGRGYSWNDVGTFESLMECANLIYNIEKKQGLEIASPDEVSYRKKLISKKKFLDNIRFFKGSSYAEYLLSILNKDSNED